MDDFTQIERIQETVKQAVQRAVEKAEEVIKVEKQKHINEI